MRTFDRRPRSRGAAPLPASSSEAAGPSAVTSTPVEPSGGVTLVTHAARQRSAALLALELAGLRPDQIARAADLSDADLFPFVRSVCRSHA